MKRLLSFGFGAFALFGVWLAAIPSAEAAIAVASCGSVTVPAAGGQDVYMDINGKLCVNATVTANASITPFAPAAYTTVTATNVSADVALPTNTGTVTLDNMGTTAVSCNLTVGAGTATASQTVIQPGSGKGVAVGSNTHVSCIDQAGSASNVVVVSGGSGQPSGWGGGSSGGGGGLSVVDASSFTASTSPMTPSGGFFQTTATSNALTNGQQGMWQMTANRAGFVNLRDTTGTELSDPTNHVVWIDTRIGGNLQSAMTNPVPAGTNTIGNVVPTAGAGSGIGGTMFNLYVQTASANSNLITSAAPHTLYEITWIQTTTTAAALRLYDVAVAPTCSSNTGFKREFPIQSNATNPGGTVTVAVGMKFTNGIGICVTGDAPNNFTGANWGGTTNGIVIGGTFG